jgi:D-glycero-alpha-D-manno-heptose-7-phosphate kinase
MRFFAFQKDGHVNVEKLDLTGEQKRMLVSNLLLFFTNKTRSSSDVLTEQKRNISERMDELRRLRDIAYEARRIILDGRIGEIGHLLHESWEEKKKLASNVSGKDIDGMYERAREAGAAGGKISGAGSGGFLLLYCPREKQNAVRAALKEYRELPFLLSRDGSKVIFNVRGYGWK